MTVYDGADAAYPNIATLPAGTVVVAGYLGGPTAYRVWTLDDWLPFKDYRQLPVWVDSQAGRDGNGGIVYATGTESGEAAVKAALALGWAPNQAARRVIAVDAETNTDYDYYAAVSDAIWAGGFVMVQYRSANAVGDSQQNPPSLTWVADYGQPKPAVMIWAGYQYAADVNGWDLDVFSQYVYDGCGVGARRAV